MKNAYKRVKCLLLAVLLLFTVYSFASCSGGVDTDEAKVFIGEFFDAIAAEDYESAETFLHPERPADMEQFLQEIEEAEGIDFQAGIEVEKYTGFSYSYYNSTVDGSRYEPTIKTKVGENTVNFTIEIVQNEKGYGIYNLDIDT